MGELTPSAPNALSGTIDQQMLANTNDATSRPRRRPHAPGALIALHRRFGSRAESTPLGRSVADVGP